MKKIAIMLILSVFLCGFTGQNYTNKIIEPNQAISVFSNSSSNSIIASKDTNLLSSYSTVFSGTDLPRKNNIEIATSAVDGTIINPDETFSFNQVVGKSTLDKGYQMSTVFLYKEKIKGLGGGICQVSGTIYNSAVYAGLDITERHHHKRKVFYVPEGKDATVAYGILDLKIKNNKTFPVKINAYIVDNQLTVDFTKL